MIGLAVLGATGSIGVSTLDVVARHPDRFRVVALTANRNHELLAAQCMQFRPQVAVMADISSAAILREELAARACTTEVLQGPQGLVDAAQLAEADAVMAAIVGAAGLMPSLAAARAGKRILLANKEALVMSGRLFGCGERVGCLAAADRQRAQRGISMLAASATAQGSSG